MQHRGSSLVSGLGARFARSSGGARADHASVFTPYNTIGSFRSLYRTSLATALEGTE
jgi:hypothetical protein